MTGRLYGLIRVALVGAALALTACQTTAPQKIPTYTGWRPMIEEQSEFRLVGPHKPRISSMRTRWYVGRVRQEQVYLETDTTILSSQFRVDFASVAFGEESSREYLSAKELTQAAASRCLGAEIGGVTETSNGNGRAVYLSCRYVNDDLCILARQGIREVEVEGPDPNYFVLADFLYCSARESEEQILQHFASLRIKE